MTNLTYDRKESLGHRLIWSHSHIPVWLLDLHPCLWFWKQWSQIRCPIEPLGWYEHIVLQHITDCLVYQDGWRCTLESQQCFIAQHFNHPILKNAPPVCDYLKIWGIVRELVYLGEKVRHEKINGTNFGTNFKTILSMSDWQNDMVPVKHFSTGTHRVSKIVPSDKEEKPYEWNLNYKICIKEPAIDVPMIWQVYVYLK